MCIRDRDNRDRIREKNEILEQDNSNRKLQVTEFISVSELASLLNVPVANVIRLFLAVCVVNIFWQTGFYYVTSSQSLLETRPLLSAGIRFIFPWTAGCILLARRIPISTLLIFGLALFACVLSLTRGAIIYLAAAFSGAFVCLFLAMLFRQISFAHVVRRLGTLAAIAAVVVVFRDRP